MPRRAELVGIVRPEVDDQELDRQASKMEREFEGAAKIAANIDTRAIQRKLERAIPGGSLLGTAVDAIARGDGGGGATTAGRGDTAGTAAGAAGSGAMLKIQESQLDKLDEIHDVLQQGAGGGGAGGGGGSGLLPFGIGTLLGQGANKIGGKAKGLASLFGSLLGKGKSLAGKIPKVGGGGGALAPIGLPSRILGDLEKRGVTDLIPDDFGSGGRGGAAGGTTMAMTGTLGIDGSKIASAISSNIDWGLPSPSDLVPENWGLPSSSELLSEFSWPDLPSLSDLSWPSLPSLSNLSWPNLPSLSELSWPGLPSLSSLSWPDLPSLNNLSWPGLPSLSDLSWPNLPSLSDLSWPSLPSLSDLSWPDLPDLPEIRIPQPDWLSQIPGVSGGNENGMAAGGVVTGPTRQLIGEGREDEAVMPLSALQSKIEGAAATGVRAAGAQPAGSGRRRPNPFMTESESRTRTQSQPTQVEAQLQVDEVSVTLQVDSLRTALQDGIDQLEDEVKRTVQQQIRNEMGAAYQ